MGPVIYDRQMLRQLDGILKGAAEVLDYAREKMAVAGDIPSNDVETLLAMRGEMAMRLARFDAGLYIPPEKLDAVADIEDEASDMLGALGLDRPDYECKEFRECRERALAALVRGSTRIGN